MGITFLLCTLLAVPTSLLTAQAIQGHLMEARTGEPIILAQITLLAGSMSLRGGRLLSQRS